MRSWHRNTMTVWHRGTQLGGVAFARKQHPTKELARQRLLYLFSKTVFPDTMSILTMPGLDWTFERSLLNDREPHGRIAEGKLPKRTRIHCIERDEPVYRAALKKMPGVNLTTIERPDWARNTIRSNAITRFHLAEFRDLAQSDDWGQYFCAWLDFNGPITTLRFEDLRQVWCDRIQCILAITCMVGRSDIGLPAEDIPALMAKGFPRAALIDQYEYSDGTPMLQFVLGKKGPYSHESTKQNMARIIA